MKADVSVSADILETLLKVKWEDEEVPQNGRKDAIKIPKNWELDECRNYRGITLLVNAGKVMNWIILERLREAIDYKLTE